MGVHCNKTAIQNIKNAQDDLKRSSCFFPMSLSNFRSGLKKSASVEELESKYDNREDPKQSEKILNIFVTSVKRVVYL